MPVDANASREKPLLSIVVPCYNEAETLAHTANCLNDNLAVLVASGHIAPDSHVIFVDDGSSDATWTLVELLCKKGSRVRGIKLAHNRGHQNALLAGLEQSDADVVITMDADLQDDPAAIHKMVNAYVAGAEIVYGVRSNRDVDSYFKRITAEGFYRFMRFLGVDMIFNHADYRLMSRRAIEALKRYGEVNLFLRAMVPMLGFRSAVVEYERAERWAGESKYPLLKMLSFALTGITSFSLKPLRIVTAIGFMVSALAAIVGLWAILAALAGQASMPGWASLLLVISFLGGTQLFAIGIVGEYVGRIYLEAKRRPRYEIETLISGVEEKEGRSKVRLTRTEV